MLAGCLERENPDLSVPIPGRYQAAATPAAGPQPAAWARSFGSPELARLVADAAENNLDIAAAIARIRQAEAQATASRSALFPQLTGSANASRQQTPSLGGSSGSSGAITRNQFSLGLDASYALDLFGQNAFTAEAAEQNAVASRFARDTVTLSTIAAVANSYFTVLAAQDRLRIAENNLKIAERVLGAVRAKLNVGIGTALDVAQQEAVVAQQRALGPPLRQQLQQTRNTLAVLLGRTPESVAIKGGSLRRLKVPKVGAGLPSQLLTRRPDIAQQEASLASAEASVEAARAAFFPSISLTAGGGLQSAALKSLLGASSLFYSVGAGLAQPIFNGYNLQAQLDLSKGRVAELAANYRAAVIQALADVENALVAVQRTGEYERLQSEAVTASRRAYDITEQRLREGTIDIVTLLNTQTTLFQAEDALVQVRLSRMQAYVSLFQALGGGWQSPYGMARKVEPRGEFLTEQVSGP